MSKAKIFNFQNDIAFSQLYRHVFRTNVNLANMRKHALDPTRGLDQQDLYFLKKYRHDRSQFLSKQSKDEIDLILGFPINKEKISNSDRGGYTYQHFLRDHAGAGANWNNMYDLSPGIIDVTDKDGHYNPDAMLPPSPSAGDGTTKWVSTMNTDPTAPMDPTGKPGGIQPDVWNGLNELDRKIALAEWIKAMRDDNIARTSRRDLRGFQAVVGASAATGAIVAGVNFFSDDAPPPPAPTPPGTPTSPPLFTESAKAKHAFDMAKSKNNKLRDACKIKAKAIGCKTDQCAIDPSHQKTYDSDKGCNHICDKIHDQCEINIGLNRAHLLADKEKHPNPPFDPNSNDSPLSYWPSMFIDNNTQVYFPQFTKWKGENTPTGAPPTHTWTQCGAWYLDPATNKPTNWDYILKPADNKQVDYSKHDKIKKELLYKKTNKNANNLNYNAGFFGENECLSSCVINDCPPNTCYSDIYTGNCFPTCGNFGESKCKANNECKWNSTKACWPKRQTYVTGTANSYLCSQQKTKNGCVAIKNNNGNELCEWDSPGFCGTSKCGIYNTKASCTSNSHVEVCAANTFDNGYIPSDQELQICNVEGIHNCGNHKVPQCGFPIVDGDDKNKRIAADNLCKQLDPYTECKKGNVRIGDTLMKCQHIPNKETSLCAKHWVPGGGIANCQWRPGTNSCQKF